MSLTMTKAEGVTVFTLTHDPESFCPPLCQILKGLCYNPACCTVSQRLRRVQRTSQSLLGALHITVGLLNIGLGAILDVRSSPYPFWLGGMYILFGIMSILSEKYPSPCLVILNVILNLFGVLFAIAAIILYSLDMAVITLWRMCEEYEDYSSYDSYDSTPSPHEDGMKEMCLKGRSMALMLIRSIIAVLMVLSVLELCITISAAVLGIKALKSKGKKANENTDDPEHYKPLQEKVAINPSV